MDDTKQWQAARDELDKMRAKLEREMEQWAEVQKQVADLYARAHRDPEAARIVAALEADMEKRRVEGKDIETKLEQLKKLMKEMQLRTEQDHRTGLPQGGAETAPPAGATIETSAVPRADGAKGSRAKRVGRFA